MKKSRLLAFVSVFIIFCFSLVPFSTLAQRMQPIVDPGVNLKVQLNGSIDNGATWYNYSGDGIAGGQNLVVKSGDEITFRLNTWNADVDILSNVTISGETDKWQYFEGSLLFYNPDLDGDTIPYTGLWDTTISVATLQGSGAEGVGDESGTLKVRLKNDIPDQTLITCVVFVENYGHPDAVKKNKATNLLAKIFGFDKARAQTGQATSVVRLLVNNNLPQTGSQN